MSIFNPQMDLRSQMSLQKNDKLQLHKNSSILLLVAAKLLPN